MKSINEIKSRIENMTDREIVDFLLWFGADCGAEYLPAGMVAHPSLEVLACTVVSFRRRVNMERRRVVAMEWGCAAKKQEMDRELMAAWNSNLEFLLGYLAERTDKAAQVIIDEAVAAEAPEAPSVDEMVRDHIDAWFCAPGCDPYTTFSDDRWAAHCAAREYDMIEMAKFIRELYIPTVLWNRAADKDHRQKAAAAEAFAVELHDEGVAELAYRRTWEEQDEGACEPVTAAEVAAEVEAEAQGAVWAERRAERFGHGRLDADCGW